MDPTNSRKSGLMDCRFTNGPKGDKTSSSFTTRTSGKSHLISILPVNNTFKSKNNRLKACWAYSKSKSTKEIPLDGWKQYEKKKWLPIQRLELFEAWGSNFFFFLLFYNIFRSELINHKTSFIKHSLCFFVKSPRIIELS